MGKEVSRPFLGHVSRNTHTRLRQRLPQDNITSERYLLTVLHDFLLYDDMNALVEEMLCKQPGNREGQELAEWVRVRIQLSR